jgi:hypothetical protein
VGCLLQLRTFNELQREIWGILIAVTLYILVVRSEFRRNLLLLSVTYKRYVLKMETEYFSEK